MVISSCGCFDHSRTGARLSLALLRMWGQPDPLEARRAHRVDYVVVYPRLADYVGHGVVEEDPGRVGDYYFLGLVVERVTLLHVGDRLGFSQKLFDLGIGIEAVVVGTPLSA